MAILYKVKLIEWLPFLVFTARIRRMGEGKVLTGVTAAGLLADPTIQESSIVHNTGAS